ncbi:TetR/AcrR family transcriptional regulator [Nocardia sp. CY41]|uniref:TetR/AcrR family transcriptional regulator n=1 Tax=Nocardia sp. CY41 TaxID=2608686 RepID=UPI00135BC079|nr:TetR/AcrR family transcriptional regulator [Nocardia sp. CY41]
MSSVAGHSTPTSYRGHMPAAPQAKPPTRRDRVVAAGREAFGRLPYDEVLISDIADTAGVAHGLPFHYFKNKRGLYIAVIRSIAEEMKTVHAVPDSLPCDEAVRRLLHQHIEYFEERAYLLGPVRGSLGLDPSIHEVFDEVRWDGALYLLELAKIENYGPVTQLLIQGWMAYIDEMIARWLAQPAILDREALIEVLVQMFNKTLDEINELELAHAAPDKSMQAPGLDGSAASA